MKYYFVHDVRVYRALTDYHIILHTKRPRAVFPGGVIDSWVIFFFFSINFYSHSHTRGTDRLYSSSSPPPPPPPPAPNWRPGVHYTTVSPSSSSSVQGRRHRVSSTTFKDGQVPSRFSPIRPVSAYNQLHERACSNGFHKYIMYVQACDCVYTYFSIHTRCFPFVLLLFLPFNVNRRTHFVRIDLDHRLRRPGWAPCQRMQLQSQAHAAAVSRAQNATGIQNAAVHIFALSLSPFLFRLSVDLFFGAQYPFPRIAAVYNIIIIIKFKQKNTICT